MNTTDYRTIIQEHMRAAFPEAEARVARFYAMQEYQLGWRDAQLQAASSDPGKLIRPQLCLLACRAVGGNEHHVLPAAAALQLVHDFSLIHDDIEDQSDTRRGRPTVWSLWGLAQGINTGDGMLIVAHLALYRIIDAGVAPTLALQAIRRFDETILTVCEGQFLDLSHEGDLTIDEEGYLAMISRKTAALIAASAGLGALIGGADAEQVHALEQYGYNLGMAFQVQDDILGIWGDPAVTGKPAAADLYRRKLSLPVIYALNQAARRHDLARLYSESEMADAAVHEALAILDSCGAQSYTERIAYRYHTHALEALERVELAGAEAVDRLRTIANQLLGRDH